MMTPASADGSSTLAEHLAQAAGGALAPEDALDLALRAIADATASRGAAVCLFDAEQGLLRLAAEVGLSDAGCRQLRTIRRFAADAWEVPLDSLLDGRMQVVTAGAGGETLPALTPDPDTVQAIACIPIRGADDSPLASLVLVVEDATAVGHSGLDQLRPALERLAAIVTAIGQRRVHPGAADEPSRSFLESLADLALKGIEPAVREAFRLLESIPHSAVPGVKAQNRDLANALDHEIRERRALEEQLTNERVAHREKLIEAETSWASERMRGRELERAIERIQSDLAAAREREQQLKAEHAAALARTAADREELIRRAREVSEVAEAARANAAADAEASRVTLAAAEANVMGLRDELRRAWADVDRLEAVVQDTKADTSKLERALQESRRLLEQAQERATQAEHQSATASEEQRRAMSRLREREAELAAGAATRVSDAERLATDLRLQLTEAHRDRERLANELVDAAEQAQRLRAEIDTVMTRVSADRDATLQQARAMVEAAEHERAVAVAEAEAVRQALAQGQALILRMEDDQVLNEQGVASREAELGQATERAQAAEARRSAAASELEQVRSELARTRTALLEREDQARRVQADLARLENLLGSARTEEERSAAALTEARATCATQSARLGELERELQGLRDQIADATSAAARQDVVAEHWRAKLEVSEASWAREHLRREELTRQHDALVTDLKELRDREQRMREELDAVQSRNVVDREETLRRAVELAETAEAARAAAVAEAEAIRVTLANSQNIILTAEDEASRARLEGERVTAELNTLRLEHQDAMEALAQHRLDEARLQRRTAELETEVNALRQQAARPTTPPAAPAGAAKRAPVESVVIEPEDGGTGPRTVTVIDSSEQGWGVGADGTITLSWVPPGPDAAARIAELAPTRIIVNLAAPGALDAMLALRAAGVRSPFWGCLTTPGATRALALGMVEVVPRPIEPDAIVAAVQGYATRGAKVLAAGGDANVFISLRQALTREGMSVSIAWDSKQATDLLAMVRPGIVIVDLALPPRDGYAFVAQLTAVDPAPITILVPRDGDPVPGLTAAAAERIGGEAALPHHRLVARVFRKSRGSA